MALITGGRLRTLALQGMATAVTALLIGGAAAAIGQPLGEPTPAATEEATEGGTENPTEGVTEDPTEDVTEDPTEDVTEDPTPTDETTDDLEATTDHGERDGHGKAVSDAARGVTPPVGDCRNHGHWVSTVAKDLASCDDNPRPAKGQVDEPAAKADKSSKATAKGKAKGLGKGNRR